MPAGPITFKPKMGAMKMGKETMHGSKSGKMGSYKMGGKPGKSESGAKSNSSSKFRGGY